MYYLMSDLASRISFEEFQQRAAWEALSGYSREQLANTKNLEVFINTEWESARDEIKSQVDDIEEAYGIFLRVWSQEFGKASEEVA